MILAIYTGIIGGLAKMKAFNNTLYITFIIFLALFNITQYTLFTSFLSLNDYSINQVFVGEVIWNATGEYAIWLRSHKGYFIYINCLSEDGKVTILDFMGKTIFQSRVKSGLNVFNFGPVKDGIYKILVDGLCNFVFLEAVYTYVDGEVVALEEELNSEKNYVYGYYVLAGPEPNKWTAIKIKLKARSTANLQLTILNRELKTLRIEDILAGQEISFTLGPPCHRSIIIVKCTSGSGKYVLKVNSYTHKTYITESMIIAAMILTIIGAIIKSKWL